MPTGLRNFFSSRLATPDDLGRPAAIKSLAVLLRTRTLAGRARLITRLLSGRAFELVVAGTAVPDSTGFGVGLLAVGDCDCDRVLLSEALAKRSGPLSGLATARPFWIALHDDQFQYGAAFLRKFNLNWCLLLPWPGDPEPTGTPFLLVGGSDERQRAAAPLAEISEAWSLLKVVFGDPKLPLDALVGSERRRRLWRAAPAALAVVNDDEVVAVNEAAGRLLSESVGRGKGAWRLWLAASARRLVAATRDCEILPATPTRDRSLEIRVGEPVGRSCLRVVAVRDATAEVAADSRQAETISTLSHELRTPLTSLKSGVELVLGGDAGPLTAQQQRLLALGSRNIERLERLITDLLDVSRADAGRLRLNRRPLDLAPLLREALETFTLTVCQRNLTVDDSGIPATFTAHVDGDKVVQMLHNVVGNAMKYTDEGGFVRVWVQERGGSVPPEAVWLADQFFLPLRTFSLVVEDNGRGMDETTQQHIFEPFHRGDEAESRRLPGAGLGLHITKSLVEIHGGSICLTSQPGLGTTVWIVLPRDPDSERVLAVSRLLAAATADIGAADLQLAALDLRRPDDRLDPTELECVGEFARSFLVQRAETGLDYRGSTQNSGTAYLTCCEELTHGLWVGILRAADDLEAAWEMETARSDCPELLVGSRWRVIGWPTATAARSDDAGPKPDPVVADSFAPSNRSSRLRHRLPID